MIQSEITQNVRDLILEIGAGVIDDTTLFRACNQAQNLIASRILSNDLIDTATLTFTAGSSPQPADYIAPIQAFDSNNDQWVITGIEDFRDETFPEPRKITNIGRTFKVYPTATATLTLDYYRQPEVFSSANNANECEIPLALHEAVILGAKWRCLSIMQEPDLARAALGEFEQYMSVNGAAASRNEERKIKSGSLFKDVDYGLKPAGGSSNYSPLKW